MMRKQEELPDTNDPAKDADQPKHENMITRLYDRLPFTLKQVDLFVKIMFVLLVCLVIYGIVKGNS